jgi:hypothetical protein
MPVSRRIVHAMASMVFAFGMAALADRYRTFELLPLITMAAFASAAALGKLVPERLDEHAGRTRLAAAADACLREGELEQAMKLVDQGLDAARSLSVRRRLWTTRAWAAIGLRDPLRAHEAIAHLSPEAIDFYLVAAYLSCCNRIDEAEHILREARERGHRDREATKLLIDLHFRRGNARAALEVAQADHGLLSSDDWRAIHAAIPDAAGSR